MKHQHYLGSLAIVAVVALSACQKEEEVNPSMPEHLNSITRETVASLWEGELNYTERFKVDIQHANNSLEVASTQVTVIDDYRTEYTFSIKAKEVASEQTNELVSIEYQVVAAGAHHLDLYYQMPGEDRKHFGAYEFAINQ